MIELLPSKRTKFILRRPVSLDGFARSGIDGHVGEIDAARDTLYGIGIRDRILDKFKDRYAYVLVKTKGTAGIEEENFEKLKDHAAAAAFDAGQVEIISADTFASISRAPATLFSEHTTYQYLREGSEDLDKDTEEGLRKLRGYTGNMAFQRWDLLSVGLRSAPLYLSVIGNRLVQEEVSPTALWIVPADGIIEEESPRPAHSKDLDEAYAVVMQVGSKADKKFAAWFGPNKEYPLGRHVIYSSDSWSDIPESGTDSDVVQEYTKDGQYIDGTVGKDAAANPLSLWASKQKLWYAPVYPFAICYGSKMSSGLMPVSTELYSGCMEIDLGVSTILGAAGRAARGTQVFEEQEGVSTELPANSDGTVVTRGHIFKQAGWSAEHSVKALEVIQTISRQLAEANRVPGFMVAATGMDRPTSGWMVALQTKPLWDYREERVELNKPSMARVFDITRMLVNSVNGTEIIKPELTEKWEPGEPGIMLSPLEEAQASKERIEAGVSTLYEEIQILKKFNSVEETIKYLESRKATEEEYADLLPTAPNAAAPAAGAEPGLFAVRR